MGVREELRLPELKDRDLSKSSREMSRGGAMRETMSES